MFNIYIYIFFNRVLYERMWRNSVQPNRPQTTIRYISIACWITRDTNTDSEHVTLTALPLQQWLHGRASALRCMHTASLVYTKITHRTHRHWGHAVAQLVEALRYKSEGHGFDSRWCHRNFSLT